MEVQRNLQNENVKASFLVTGIVGTNYVVSVKVLCRINTPLIPSLLEFPHIQLHILYYRHIYTPHCEEESTCTCDF